MNIGESRQNELLRSVVRLDANLLGKTARPPGRPDRIIRSLFFPLGAALGKLLLAWPGARIANLSTLAIARLYAGRAPPDPDRESVRNLGWAGELLRSAGKGPVCPALLVLTSHPETLREKLYLLGLLIHRSVRSAAALAPSAKLDLIQAVDGFALEQLPSWLAGAYAGLIFSGHIPFDRMPPGTTGSRSRRDYFASAVYRILDSLRSGRTFCAALGGGVAHNARLLYSAREFGRRVYFSAAAPGPARSRIEKEARDILARSDAGACLRGGLEEHERKELEKWMSSLNVPAERRAELLDEIGTEMARETPSRTRFFRILFGRIPGKGRPLLLLPVAHDRDGAIRTGKAEMMAG